MIGRNSGEDTEAVTAFLQQLASAPLEAPPLPDPSLLWWKAQLLRQWDAQRQAALPIDVSEHVQIGIGCAGIVALLAWLWRAAPSAFGPIALMLAAVAILAVGSLAALTLWGVGARE